MSHGWDTGSWGLWNGSGEETVLQDVQGLHNQGEQENKDREVKEGNGSLSFSTSVLGTLGDLVVVNVITLGTWVASDGDSQCSGTSKCEDKVHEVEDCQE